MSSKPLTFVIYANSFDDRSGGFLVMHLLAERLAQAGEVALLWPGRPRLQWWRNPRRYIGWLRYHIAKQDSRYSTGPFTTPIAHTRDLANAIVVYPEIITGNPLGARHVVRWLLHKPGFHSGKICFGSDDLFFYYQDAFYDPKLGNYHDNRLAITWWNSEYRLFNEGERSGSCYLVKKGVDRPLVHVLDDSILVDPLSHREKAEVFNRTKYFYSYDLYTLYARYAALCGCIPIIVPQPGMTREQWVPHEEERYGLAYGEEDIDWAVATRDLLLRQIGLEQTTEAAMVRSFVDKCRARFFGDRCNERSPA